MNRPHHLSLLSPQLLEQPLSPAAACARCAAAAARAYSFRLLAEASERAWTAALDGLARLPAAAAPPAAAAEPARSVFAFLADGGVHVLRNDRPADAAGALARLKELLGRPRAPAPRRRRAPRAATPRAPPCPDCGKQLPNVSLLNLHLLNSAKQACVECGRVTARGAAMRAHLAAAHRRAALLCAACPALCASAAELAAHAAAAHHPAAHSCAHCGRAFQRRATFEAHQQMHCSATCRACGAQFSSRTCYRAHRAACEPGAAERRRRLPRRARSNLRDPGRFECDYCHKAYQSRPQLKNHILWIHMDVRNHQCAVCEKRFYTAARLAEHLVVHTRARNWPCDVCGARLVTRMALVYHRRRHTGEKPYECEDCGERFISSSRRSEHMKRRHGKGQMFTCEQCGAAFVRSHELRKHQLKAHAGGGAQPAPPRVAVECV